MPFWRKNSSDPAAAEAAAAATASVWKGRLESVAIGLLTLEVNTIRKCGMSAQKMPDVPIALHSIADCYNDYLKQRHFGVEKELLTWARNRIAPPEPPPDPQYWFNKLIEWQPTNEGKMKSVDLTNGAETFEALRWAAESALRADDQNKKSGTGQPFEQEERAVVSRIMANCRQLTPAVLVLQKAYETIPGRPKPGDPEAPLLINGTLEQTARACFDGVQHLPIPLNVAVLVRKMWDIGVETVLAQTSVQVDGDVVTRVSPTMLAEHRDFLLGLHNTALQTGLGQWKGLYDLLAQLIGGLADRLFKAF